MCLFWRYMTSGSVIPANCYISSFWRQLCLIKKNVSFKHPCVWLYQCPGRNRSWVCFDLGQCRRQAERPIWVKSSLPSDRCNSCAKYKNHEIQQFQTNPVSWVGVGDIHFSCNACDVLTMQCFGILNDGIFYRFLFNSKRCDLLSKFKKSKISCKYKVPSTKW